MFRFDKFDCFLGFVGGSSLDESKAISAMSKSYVNVRNYKQTAQLNLAGVPMILILTSINRKIC